MVPQNTLVMLYFYLGFCNETELITETKLREQSRTTDNVMHKMKKTTCLHMIEKR